METIQSLLDNAKVATKKDSDYGLAKALGIHKARISAYYSRKETPNEFICLKLAQALGRSYEEVSAIVRIEAEKDENRRNVWKDYLKRIGGLAASIALLFFLSVTLIVTSTPAEASNGKCSEAEDFVLCKILRILRRVSASVWNTLTSAFPHYGYLN